MAQVQPLAQGNNKQKHGYKNHRHHVSTNASVHALITPAMGSRLYVDDDGTILLGQPPEVLKGLLLHGISNFDTLVLPDVKEKMVPSPTPWNFHCISFSLSAMDLPIVAGSTWSEKKMT